MGGPRRLVLEPMGSTLWENIRRSPPPLCNGRCNGHLTAIGAPGLFLALQRSKNRSDLTGRNAGGKPTPIAVDLTRRAPLGSPWFGLCSRLPPGYGFWGGAPPPPPPGGAGVGAAAPPRAALRPPGGGGGGGGPPPKPTPRGQPAAEPEPWRPKRRPAGQIHRNWGGFPAGILTG